MKYSELEHNQRNNRNLPKMIYLLHDCSRSPHFYCFFLCCCCLSLALFFLDFTIGTRIFCLLFTILLYNNVHSIVNKVLTQQQDVNTFSYCRVEPTINRIPWNVFSPKINGWNQSYSFELLILCTYRIRMNRSKKVKFL